MGICCDYTPAAKVYKGFFFRTDNIYKCSQHTQCVKQTRENKAMERSLLAV